MQGIRDYQIKSNIFDNTNKSKKQTNENEKITGKCMKKNSKTTMCWSGHQGRDYGDYVLHKSTIDNDTQTFSWADLLSPESNPELQYSARTRLLLFINGDQLCCCFDAEVVPLMYLRRNFRSLSKSQLISSQSPSYYPRRLCRLAWVRFSIRLSVCLSAAQLKNLV